jgi:argininosuccinate lyase
MQEDKEPFFDAFGTAADCLEVFAGAWETMQLRPARMEAAVDDAALATDLADYLARRGVPFREAHHVVGRLVRFALGEGRPLRGLALAELQSHSPAFGEDALALLDLRHSLGLRNIEGGTGPHAVRSQLAQARAVLAG